MSHRSILCWALTPLLGLPIFAQSVISAHSGLVQFAEGSVLLDDQPVQLAPGKFEQMNNGSELRTQEGRVEVLLTPGTYLRLGSHSAVRMISNQLDNTRVELLNGSAVLDQGSDTLANTAVTMLYNLDEVHIQKPGRYRFDSQPPQVKIETGDAEVKGADGTSVEAKADSLVPLTGKLEARRLLNDPPNSGDDLDNWAADRDRQVAEDVQNASTTADLGGVVNGWQNDPDALLQSLGIAPYPPGMSAYIPPYTYGGLYGVDPYAGALYGSMLYGPGYGPFGFFAVDPLAFYYPTALYLPYGYAGLNRLRRGIGSPGRLGTGVRYNYGGSSIYRNSTIYRGSPIYRGSSIYRSPSLYRYQAPAIRIQPNFGRPAIGGFGGVRPMGGAVHVGGAHR